MSVKLPNIKKQQSPQSPKSPSNNSHLQSQSYPNQEQMYQQQQTFEELQQNKPAVETVTALKSQTKGQINVQVTVHQKSVQQEKKQVHNIKQIEQDLNQKIKISNALKVSIEEKKKQIKSIGQQIDKDLNKSLLKATKPNAVNIRDIFSGTQKSNSQTIQQINQQLNQTRTAIRKVKHEIQKTHQGISDPVSLLNQDRGIQYKTKIKNTQSQIKTIQHEKTMLQQEISRGGRQFDQEQQKQKSQDLHKLQHQLYEIQNHQKEQRLKLYHIEKEDITLMEKIKFFQQRQNGIGNKKSKISPEQKQKMQAQMKQLIIEINQTMQQKNKSQMQQKKLMKQLTQQITSLETKNWDFFNKLRQIDAFLLQYYEKKTRRKEGKNLEKTIDVMQKPTSSKMQTHSIASETLKKSKYSVNDKNVTNDAPLVQKKKTYDFGCKDQLPQTINISDDFLGPNLTLKSIEFKSTQSRIWSINAQYINQHGNKVSGLTMGNKTLPQNISTHSLFLEKEQVVNFVHAGFSQNKAISFLHLVTSEGKQIKWGSVQKLVKSEQKHIKKYQTCLIKTKFYQNEKTKSQNFQPFLVGLSLQSTFMAPK